MWVIPRMWEGGDCWIIGGGSSMLREFKVPLDLELKVRNKEEPMSSLGPYFSPIHGKHIIGINAAFLLGDWIDVVFFGDSKFYMINEEALIRFPNIKITCNPNLKSKFTGWNVKEVRRDHRKSMGLSTTSNQISWNSNTGAAGIDLAVHFGAKRIFLLGFDMKLGGNNGEHQHWHNHYRPPTNRKEHDNRKLPFSKHLRCFPYIAQDAKRKEIEIINVTQDTAIKNFPCKTLEEVL